LFSGALHRHWVPIYKKKVFSIFYDGLVQNTLYRYFKFIYEKKTAKSAYKQKLN